MSKINLALGALLAAPCIVAGAAEADTRLSFASGVDYSSGDYGDVVDTEVVSVPLTARLTSGGWSFRASIPYLSITGPADIDLTEGGGDGGAVARTGTERGFGDTSLSATHSFRHLGGRESDVYIDVTGRVRLPSGDDEKGLGSGTTDYALVGEVGNSGDGGGIYLSGGRRFLGDRTGVERQDGWQGTVGGWVRAGENVRMGGSYSWREASLDGNEDPSEVNANVSFRLNESLRMSLNAGAGLSEASADYSGGIRFTWRSDPFNR
jgi:hypothetical protein